MVQPDLMEELQDPLGSISAASCISEAMLRLNTLEHKDPKRRPSLAKAYHFVMAGGLSEEKEWENLGRVSLATLKTYWRQSCYALPFYHALEVVKIDIAKISPMAFDGAKQFTKRIAKEPDIFTKYFGVAKGIQKQILQLLDDSAKRSQFIQFPEYVTPIPWAVKSLSKKQIEISRTYNRKSL